MTADLAAPGANADRMTLVEHLVELRQRIVKTILAVFAGAVIAFMLYPRFLEHIAGYFRKAVNNPDAEFLILSPVEGITTRLTVATYGGMILALPVIMWQFWKFIAPGLYAKERKYGIVFVFSSVLLFFMGAAIAVLTLPQALKFLVSVSGSAVETRYSPAKFVNFVTLLVIAFGFSFEFPIVLVFLQAFKIVTHRQLLRAWRYAMVGIFVFAALATPSQDPWSLFGMALPMCLFYFIAIVVGKLLRRKE